MQHRFVVSSALASAIALGLVGTAAAQDASSKDREKCYGIAKAGGNDCASLAGKHDCAGEAKVDNAAEDWKYVAKGTCRQLQGLTEAQAKAKLKWKKAA
jgi:uncharacterized membrane protein